MVGRGEGKEQRARDRPGRIVGLEKKKEEIDSGGRKEK